jgi:hypothetical protein
MQQNKGNDVDQTGTQTGLTGGGLTASPRFLQNKSKPKMVKPKKSEIGVWKTIESKGRKHQREKLKLNELLAKSQRQNNVNGASRSKNSKPKIFS